MPLDPSRKLPDEKFPSRVDLWLIALIVTSVAAPVVIVAIPSVPGNNAVFARVGVLVSTVLVSLCFGWFLRGTSYTLRADELFVRGGPRTWHIPYADIRRAEWSSSFVSAPALSLRRLKICYGADGWVIISPQDRDLFVDALKRRVPGLKVVK